MRWWRLFVIVFSLISCFSVALAEEQPQTTANIQRDIIRAVTPAENAQVVGKKPEIKIEFLEPITPNTLVVLLDGTDISQLLTVTDKGFEYKPFMVMPAGSHNLSITANDKNGNQVQKSISFTTRHTSTFEEAYTDNEASVIYEQVIEKPNSAQFVPNSKVEGNLRSDSKIKEKGWEFQFNTNLRYLDQSIPVALPLKKGIDAANWLFTGSYTKDNLKFKASLGDVQVNETQYTVVNLARKGGVFNLEYDNFQINMFSVKGVQVLGLRGVGVDFDTNDHILGVSGGVNLFDKKVMFKTIYVTGGEPGGSLGISTTLGPKKGDVLGFVLTSDLLENKVKTEFETDFSKFDPDTSDEFKSKSDHAYKLKVGGNLGVYTYDTMYEYIGRDYAVVGNQGLPKDREGASIMNGLNLGVHTINLTLSRYNDNVKGDELFPRILNYQGGLDYSFNGIPNLPMGVNYQKSIQNSTREPSGTNPLDLHADTVSGRVNYTLDKINLGVLASYSLLDDRTPTNNDTTAINYTFTSSYNIPNITVSPSFSLNQSKIHVTDVRTDTYTINLDLRTRFFRERLTFDVGGTYNIIKADNGLTDSRNLNTNFRLAYNIKEFFKGLMNPTIALRGAYMKVTDKINRSSDRDELTLFLVLATSVPFSF